MKNFSIALVLASSLAVSLSAFAAKGAPYQAPAAEPEMAHFTLTGGATYLSPSLNGLDYLSVVNTDPESISTTTYRLEPGYDFGYFLGFGYLISDRYDVQATWTQFDSESTDSLLLDSNDTSYAFATSNIVQNALSFNQLLYTEAQETLNFQAFDATLGQYHSLADNLMTRVFVGVRYAKVDNKTVNDYSFNDTTAVYTGFESYDSTFSGVGPEVGLDMNYSVIDWFGIVGHFAGAFLIGQQETESNLMTDLNDSTRQLPVYADNGTIMVPAIDAKLGVNLGVPFMDLQDRFMIEAGYQVAYYFNVVDQVQEPRNQKFETVHNVSDVGMMGPYMNLGFKF